MSQRQLPTWHRDLLTGNTRHYTLEHLMETGAPFTLKDLQDLLRKDRESMQAEVQITLNHALVLDSSNADAMVLRYMETSGRIIRVHEHLCMFNVKNDENKKCVEKAYLEKRLLLIQ